MQCKNYNNKIIMFYNINAQASHVNVTGDKNMKETKHVYHYVRKNRSILCLNLKDCHFSWTMMTYRSYFSCHEFNKAGQ